MNNQNDKQGLQDMSSYKPANFDAGFKAGKGWGDMSVRVQQFYAARPDQIRSLSPAPIIAVKINRHL